MNQQSNGSASTRSALVQRAATLVGMMLFAFANATVMAAEPVPATTRLADAGNALQKVIVSERATPRTRAAADSLAGYLARISGAPFVVEVGDGSSGIAVGQTGDFPTLQLEQQFAPAEPFRRQDYLLRSRSEGVLVIGATDPAVEFAVWDFLYRLGHRQFFPGETWEVIPSTPSLAIAVDTFEQPDFYTRWIWYGHGLWDYNKQPYADWSVRNRAVQGFGLSTGHVYQAIIKAYPEVFEKHPEYLGLVDGQRQGNKFCISNPDLRRFIVVQYALRYFHDNPDRDTVSMEPSDGGGWCECDACAALGSITDRALLLANEAAEAVSKAFPDKYVGFLAYNQHSPPPNIRVHPKVLVKVQTGFIRGGYTFDQLIRGWQEKGAMTGVGDYYSVFLSDMSRPASQKGSDLFHIRTSIPTFHLQGARFYMAESSDLWGAVGLGHYIAARLAWDTSNAEKFDALVDDFLVKSFGPAKPPMEQFFRLIYRFEKNDRRPLLRSDMVARMYRWLAEAKELSGGDALIEARLNDLLLFTRYEDLFQAYEDAKGAPRQQAFEALLQHTWRMRETMMVHAKPIIMHLSRKDQSVKIPSDEKKFKVDQAFSATELDEMLAAGVANTKLVDIGFEPVDFSRDLVPATALGLPAVKPGSYNRSAPMGRQKFFSWLDAPGALRLRISGGHIKHYRDIASNVQTRLYADANPIVGEEVDFDESVAPDGVEREVVLNSPFEGVLQVNVLAPSNRAMVDVTDLRTPWTMESSLETHNELSGVWDLYFYVPKGTKVVGGFAAGSGRGEVLDGAGKPVFAFATDMQVPGFFKIDVPAGQDGKLWKFHQCMGRRALLTVPPFLACSAEQLLLPREVVEVDSGKNP